MLSLSTTTTDTKRAKNVCQACLLRKKTCDKALPACAFCARRRLLCRYDFSATKSRGRQIHDPVKHFIPIHSVDESLLQLAQHLAELTQLTEEIIIDRYFEHFHRWLPVVSPDSFRREASRYREEGRVPSADFTVVLLAMLQIILPALGPALRPSGAKRDLVYTSVKSAFAQAQTSVCTCVRLVQAATLIALHEHVCVRPESAYVSMMTCVGLAQVLGVGVRSVGDTRDVERPSNPFVEEIETQNLVWVIAMLERLILCEMDQQDLRPHTEYPAPDRQLPSNLTPAAQVDSKPGPNLQALDQITSSNLTASPTDQFGRQAQLLSLLDRLFTIRRLPAHETASKFAHHTELDGKIRGFLAVVMSQLEWKQTRTCTLVALSVRLLFLLHRSILATLQPSSSTEPDSQKREISLRALDTACRMTLDIVHVHGDVEARELPPCCFYNLQAARGWLQERGGGEGWDEVGRDVERLRRTEEGYSGLWVF